MTAFSSKSPVDFSRLPYDLGNPEVRREWEGIRPETVPEWQWLYVFHKHLTCLMTLVDASPDRIWEVHHQWLESILATHHIQ